MIDLLTLFFMLFCAGYMDCPPDFTYQDAKGNTVTATFNDQDKADYYQWLQDNGYKDDGGIIDQVGGS